LPFCLDLQREKGIMIVAALVAAKVLQGEGYAIPFISKKLSHFLVNLAKTCTDITFEIRGDCTGLGQRK
jgi:hypothetical protein